MFYWLFLDRAANRPYTQSAMNAKKVAIIGSGPAGYTAAIYAARAKLEPVVYAGPEPGGQLAWTTDVGNFPGFPDDILGPELMDRMKRQAEKYGATIMRAIVTKVDFSTRPLKLWVGETVQEYESVIVATGASAKWLGLPNEQRLRGHGVSACATCDGFFFKGKDVAVIGGGDAAMEDATFLTRFAKSVTVVVRGETLRASRIMADRAKANPKISWRMNTGVVDVLGQDAVSGLTVHNNQTSAEEDIAVQGVFVAIGHQPNTEIFKPFLPVDQKGYLEVIDQVRTTIDGVFVAGDVRDHRYRQAITAAGMGCMAALEAEKYLAS